MFTKVFINNLNIVINCKRNYLLDLLSGTEYMQNKFLSGIRKLVGPVTFNLGGPASNDSFQYVPLLQGLQQLLEYVEVFDEVLKDHRRNDGL